MSFHNQTFHQESFVEKLAWEFRGGGLEKPTTVTQDDKGDYYQIQTHSTNIPIDPSAYRLLDKHNKKISGIGYTNKKGIIIHITRK